MLEGQIYKAESDICGVFRLHFCDNLFGPQYECVIINYKNITLPIPIPDEEKKIKAPQRSVKTKI